MEYNFRDKNYKISGFKTFLTNQLKKQSIETVYQFLTEFIQTNDFEYKDMLSILARYIDYSNKVGQESEKTLELVDSNLAKFPEKNTVESILPISNLYYQIKSDFALSFLDKNLEKIPNNTKEKINALLFKSDLLVEKKDYEAAFSLLRNCSNQSYDLYIFDSLGLKRTIFEKMAIIGELENKSDVAINYYIYYCAFQASCEFLRFPYLDSYRNYQLTCSIIENPQNEIIQIDKHLEKNSINISLFNSFLQEIYRNEIPKAFKLDNFDIDNFNVSNYPIRELTYYSNYIINLSVNELVSTIEFFTSQKIKNLK